MKPIASLVLALFTMPAMAQQLNVPADITFTCNDNGAVVHLPDGSKSYLGKDCDAYQPGVGSGRWYFAAASFIVEINSEGTAYAYDIPCDVPYCQYVE